MGGIINKTEYEDSPSSQKYTGIKATVKSISEDFKKYTCQMSSTLVDLKNMNVHLLPE